MNLQEILNQIIEIYNQYRLIIFSVIIFFVALAISQLIYNCLFIIENIGKPFILVFKIVKAIFTFIFKIFKFLLKGIIYVLTFWKRIKRKKELLNSVFNVVPKAYKIPFFHRIFNFKVRKQIKNRIYCIEKCFETQETINSSCSYITMIEASVGGGKTSLCNGYSHYRTLILQEMIQDDLDDIERKIFDCNYVLLRKKIEELYNIGESETSIYDIIVNQTVSGDYFEGFYDDFVSEIPKESLLKKYITAYCALLRNNYTMCNYRLFNRITKTYNYVFDQDLFNIKNEKSRSKFYLPSYCTFVDDEKALSEFKNTASAKELDKTGVDITLRLFRQLKEETLFYISSTQNTSRIALLLRELANTYLSIQSFHLVGSQNSLANIYRKKQLKLEKKMYKYANKHFKDEKERELYLSTENDFKVKIHEWYLKERALYSASFIRYRIKVAKSLGDLQSDKAEEYDWYFPITWVFGVYRKCEYSDFYEFLSNLSGIKTDHELKVITSLYEKSTDKFEELLDLEEKEKVQ